MSKAAHLGEGRGSRQGEPHCGLPVKLPPYSQLIVRGELFLGESNSFSIERLTFFSPVFVQYPYLAHIFTRINIASTNPDPLKKSHQESNPETKYSRLFGYKTERSPARGTILSIHSVSPWGRARTQDHRAVIENRPRSVSPWGRARTQDKPVDVRSRSVSVSPWGRARTQDGRLVCRA